MLPRKEASVVPFRVTAMQKLTVSVSLSKAERDL